SDSFASSSSSTPDFKIAEVPANLTGNRWEAYYCEAIMMIALLGYLINFLSGRTSIDSMLVELRFIKRQCLFNSLAALIK
ncbi:unnamed protein product, partial [Rotaria sp. Silwood1]